MADIIQLVLQEATPIVLQQVAFEGQGPPGLSAYQVAVANGFSGTEAEWLASLEAGSGAPGNTVSLPALENISSGRVLSITDAGVQYFNPDGTLEPAGIALNAATSGDNVNIVLFGKITISGWGLTPETPYYANTNGTLSTSPSSTGRSQLIGISADAETLYVNIQQAIFY